MGITTGIGGGGSTIVGTLASGSKDVTTAGTAEALSATNVAIRFITIVAKSANTGKIFVGGSGIDNSKGVSLSADDTYTITIADLAEVYIDSAVNGEGVTFTYGVF